MRRIAALFAVLLLATNVYAGNMKTSQTGGTGTVTFNQGALSGTCDDIDCNLRDSTLGSSCVNVGGDASGNLVCRVDDDVPESTDFDNLSGGVGIDHSVEGTLKIDLYVSSGSTGVSSSSSGMQYTDSKLTLLRGCADNQILKWNDSSNDWNCEADNKAVSPFSLADGASFSSVNGQFSWDSDTTPPMATIGDGTNALPLRSCWAGGRNGFLSSNKNSWGMLLGHGDLDILNNHALQIGAGGNCATSECYGRGGIYGQLGYDQAPADITITNFHCRLHNDAKVDIDWTFDMVKVTDPELCGTYLNSSGGSSICWDTDITTIVASTACTIKGESNINEHECGDGTGGAAWAATDSFSIEKGDLMSLRANVNTAPTQLKHWSCSFIACIDVMP